MSQNGEILSNSHTLINEQGLERIHFLQTEKSSLLSRCRLDAHALTQGHPKWELVPVSECFVIGVQ